MGVRGMLAFAFVACAARANAQSSASIERYNPAPRAEDGFALSGADPGPHLHYAANLQLDYARNPLVYENVAGDAGTTRLSLVSDQLRAHLALSLGLFDATLLYVALPVDLWRSEERRVG